MKLIAAFSLSPLLILVMGISLFTILCVYIYRRFFKRRKTIETPFAGRKNYFFEDPPEIRDISYFRELVEKEKSDQEAEKGKFQE